ncbi:hypothetical protein RX717_05520 [Intestinibacillus sp. NTUH-41-i26]|uniref:hypothetical protein n=1 Tax=Intestinibacillus sp. NTUH-41-i26 TaxID=3079303 RepID=UPI0029346F14|nr:hypothetical protein [Intestinibacillus sp. NTUH-41-i26]WOC76441.1 hypothetical protein RX717_05520 [Intestinibacillus sp. NTUH-41-i26]
MTDREAQIEALWIYEISTEKVLRRAVKKGFITQAEADEFSEKLFEQLDTKKIRAFSHRRWVRRCGPIRSM